MRAYRFDTDTATTPTGVGRAAATLQPEWNVDGRILNGGYVQAVLLDAALAAHAAAGAPTADPPPPGRDARAAGRPVAVSTVFAAAPDPGRATARVRALRAGRRIAALTATLHQGGGALASSLISVAAPGSLPDRPPSRTALPMPPVPPAEDCLRVRASDLPGPPGLAALLDYAFVPEQSRWLAGDTSGGPHIRCWLAFRDGRPLDLQAALAMVDMAPPVCFAQGRFGWAPTLQLQVGVFAAPGRGPFLLDLRGAPYDGAVVAEDGLLWDADGTLVARSRQIALAPRA